MNTKKSELIRPGSHGYCTDSGDTLDCTVRAAVNATGKDYASVYATLKKHGRVDGRGAYNETILKAYTELGLELIGTFGTTKDSLDMAAVADANKIKFSRYVGMTLKTFLSRRPVAPHVCLNRNHAFAIVNGGLVDIDVLPAGTCITAIFKVVK